MCTSLPHGLLMVVIAAFIGIAAPCYAQTAPAPVASITEPISTPQPPKSKPPEESKTEQERALAELGKQGGAFERDSSLPDNPVRMVYLNTIPVGDADLKSRH